MIYSGHDCKIIKNMIPGKKKLSKLESQLYEYIVYVALILVLMCTLMSVLQIIWLVYNHDDHSYIPKNYSNYFTFFVV